MIIGFLGRKRSGKDTVVNYLVKNYNFIRYAFGDPVKEVCKIMFNPNLISYEELLKVFWETHDPTTLNKQGDDIGSQYRSGIYTYDREDFSIALKTRNDYEKKLKSFGFSMITTEILEAMKFYYAEDYHQQYLAKNPNGYCGLGGTGVGLK